MSKCLCFYLHDAQEAVKTRAFAAFLISQSVSAFTYMTPKKVQKRRFCTFLDKSKRSAYTYMTPKKGANEGFAPFLISQNALLILTWRPRRCKNEDFAPFLISQSASHFDCMSLAIGGKIDLQLRQEGQKAVAFCGFLISQNAPLILTWRPKSLGNVRFQGFLDKSKCLCLYLHDTQERCKTKILHLSW